MKSGGTSEEVDEEEEEEGGGSYEMKGEKRLLAHVHATPSHVYGFFFFFFFLFPVCTTRLQLFFSISNVDKCVLSLPTFDLPFVRCTRLYAPLGGAAPWKRGWGGRKRRRRRKKGERKKATAQSNVNPKRVIFK